MIKFIGGNRKLVGRFLSLRSEEDVFVVRKVNFKEVL